MWHSDGKDTTRRPLSMGSVKSRPLGAYTFSFCSLMYLAIFFNTWTQADRNTYTQSIQGFVDLSTLFIILFCLVLFRNCVAVFFLSCFIFNILSIDLNSYKIWLHKQNTEIVLPFHSVSPYKGRLYKPLDKPGSPPNKTSPQVSQPLHTGCSESGWFLQTAAYQAETTQKFRNNLHY